MRDPAQRIELNIEERTSGAWVKTMRHLRARLDHLRIKNDIPTDEATTAKTRGQIAEVKELMKLGDDPIIVEAGHNDFK